MPPPQQTPLYIASNGGCGTGWLRFQKSCLRALRQHDSATAHEQRCVELGGNLVALTTLEKHDFVCVNLIYYDSIMHILWFYVSLKL